MRFLKDFLAACVFGPAFMAGWVFHMIAEGFAFGRKECEAAIVARVNEHTEG